MLASSEIERMSPSERIQTMELLWKSISASGQPVSSPDWHGQVLAARKAKVVAGESRFLSLSELKARLATR